MGKENIFKRILAGIVLFLKTITGIQSRMILSNISKQLDIQREESIKLDARMIALLAGIKRKAFFPILLNSKGKGINALIQRDFKTEITYNASGSTLKADLTIDRMHFEKYEVNLEKSYIDNVNHPLFSYAKQKFEERDRKFMDDVAKNFTYAIFANSFEKEVLQSDDILEILGKTIIMLAKPGYIEAKNLKDFIIDKGPVEKEPSFDPEKETTNEA